MTNLSTNTLLIWQPGDFYHLSPMSLEYDEDLAASIAMALMDLAEEIVRVNPIDFTYLPGAPGDYFTPPTPGEFIFEPWSKTITLVLPYEKFPSMAAGDVLDYIINDLDSMPSKTIKAFDYQGEEIDQTEIYFYWHPDENLLSLNHSTKTIHIPLTLMAQEY